MSALPRLVASRLVGVVGATLTASCPSMATVIVHGDGREGGSACCGAAAAAAVGVQVREVGGVRAAAVVGATVGSAG
jgi:hypothetical protein